MTFGIHTLSISKQHQGTQCFDQEFSKDASTQTEWLEQEPYIIVPTKYATSANKRERIAVNEAIQRRSKMPKV